MSNTENLGNQIQNAIAALPVSYTGETLHHLFEAAQAVSTVLPDSQSVELRSVYTEISTVRNVLGYQEERYQLAKDQLLTYLSDIGLGHTVHLDTDASSAYKVDAAETHPPSTSPENVSETPEDWDRLIGISECLLQSGMSPEMVSLRLQKEFSSIGGQKFDELRFYALGELSAAFKQRLDDPAVRADIIEKGTQCLVDDYAVKHKRFDEANANKPGLRVGAVAADILSNSTAEDVYKAYAVLPASVRMLGDSLECYKNANKNEVRQDELRVMVQPGTLAKSLNTNALAGVTFMMRECLRLYELATKPQNPSLGTEARIGDVIDVDDLGAIKVRQASHAAATLHVDELEEVVRDKAALHADGAVRLSHKDFPKSPPPAQPHNPYPVWHRERIGCPALYVRELIPLVSAMLPQMVQRAEARIQIG